MALKLTPVRYTDLNGRQKENFNYQKVSAVLADYGFVTTRLTDDWEGADFIAHHIDGETLIRVQLKSRLTFNRKYQGKDLYVAFYDGATWYLYPHDELLERVLAVTGIGATESWRTNGGYSFPRLSVQLRELLEPYRFAPPGDARSGVENLKPRGEARIDLPTYDATWSDDDPHANFKAEVSQFTRSDPLPTLANLSQATGIPLPCLVRYVLVKWAASGAEALLAMDPIVFQQMRQHVEDAEQIGTDKARLQAYAALQQMVAWLGAGLGPDADEPGFKT